MSLVFALAAHHDVQTVIVTDAEGRLVEAMGEGDTDRAAATMGGVVSALRDIGQRMQLGKLERVDFPDRACFLALKDSRVVILYMRPGRPRDVADGLLAQIPWDTDVSAPALLELQEEEQGEAHLGQIRTAMPTPLSSRAVSVAVPSPSNVVPPSSEYQAMRPGLLAARNDRAALQKLVGNRQPEAAARWKDAAIGELGQKLERLQPDEAKLVGELIASLLDLGGPKGSSKTHREWLSNILSAVAAIQIGDYSGAQALLRTANPAERCELLVWPTSILLSRAALGTGAIETAESNARAALTMTGRLGREEECASLLQLGEVALAMQHAAVTSQCIATAKRLAVEIAAPERLAQAWLLEARALAGNGKAQESLYAARRAQQSCPTAPQAYLYQARRAVAQAKLWDAESQMQELSKMQLSRAMQREIQLLSDVVTGAVPSLVGAEFIRLDDLSPTDQVLAQLRSLQEGHPDLIAPWVLLAWKLMNLGKLDDAAALFERLAARELSTEVRADVTRGQQCVAEAQQRALASSGSSDPQESLPSSDFEDYCDDSKDDDLVLPLRDDEARDSADEFLVREGSLRRAAAFTGDIELLAFPDLLEYLRNTRRTGRLVIDSDGNLGTVLLRDGQIVGATAPGTGRIGETLLRKGAVTKDQLGIALEKQRQQSRPLGSVLVELKYVEQAAIQEAMRTLIMSAIRELLEWRHGQFQFDAHTEVESEISLDVRNVLMDLFGGEGDNAADQENSYNEDALTEP